jgi:hypothetical protein
MVLLITEVGNSVGSAIATAIWRTNMPRELAIYVPTNNATLLAELYGSITNIALYPVDDPIRIGAITAYQAVMYSKSSFSQYPSKLMEYLELVLGAVICAIFPPIFCLLFTKNIRLTRAQNAVDNKDAAGRPTGEVADEDVVTGEGEGRRGLFSQWRH